MPVQSTTSETRWLLHTNSKYAYCFEVEFALFLRLWEWETWTEDRTEYSSATKWIHARRSWFSGFNECKFRCGALTVWTADHQFGVVLISDSVLTPFRCFVQCGHPSDAWTHPWNPFANSIASCLAIELDRGDRLLQLAIVAIGSRSWKRLVGVSNSKNTIWLLLS